MQKAMLVASIILLASPSIGLAAGEKDILIDDPLAPVAYLVGGIWTSSGEIQGFGAFTAERSYRWTLDGKFIEQLHVMKLNGAEFHTKGIIGWDPVQEAIVAWGFGDDGGFVTSRASLVSEDELLFEGERVGHNNAGPVRAKFQKTGDDTFTEIAEINRDGNWSPMFIFRFERTR